MEGSGAGEFVRGMGVGEEVSRPINPEWKFRTSATT